MWVWTDELTDLMGDAEAPELPLVALYVGEHDDREPPAPEIPDGGRMDSIVARAS